MVKMAASKKNYSTFSKVSKFVSISLLVFVISGAFGDDEVIDLEKIVLRPRLGHFADADGFLEIFQAYFNNVIMINDRAANDLADDHWRRFRPSGELCLNFLQGFKEAKGYTLNKPYDIIPLDACLDWLFDDSSEKKMDLDHLNVVAQGEALKMARDQRLRDIFESTHFRDDSVPHELKKHLFDYLVHLLKINADNPRNGCHGLWLEGYTDFIEDIYLDECDDDSNCVYFGWPDAAQDSYLKLIVESTKTASKNCYKVMQKQVKRLMQQAYMDEPKMTRHFLTSSSKAAKQSDALKWGREMMQILQLVTATDPESPVDLGDVVRDLNKLKYKDEDTVERFTQALGKYAIQNVNLKESENDPLGRARFGKAMVKLCRPYINKKIFLALTGGSNLWEDPNLEKRPFEFYSIVYGLVRLTNHESLYGVSKANFEEDVIKNGWESLYLATFACQLISSTYAELNYDTNEVAFDVAFRSGDEQILIDDWPIEVMMRKQAKDGTKFADAQPKTPSGSGSSGKSLLGFGLKFGLSSKSKNTAPPKPLKTPTTQPMDAAEQEAIDAGMASEWSPAISKARKAQQQAKEQPKESRAFRFGIRFRHKTPATPAPVEAPPAVKAEEITPAPPAPAPKPEPEPAKASNNAASGSPTVETDEAPESAPAAEPEIPLRSIRMYKDRYGKYPAHLPQNIRETHPSLPKNLDGEYPKKTVATGSSRPRLADMRAVGKGAKSGQPAAREAPPSRQAASKATAKADKWANVDSLF